MRYGLRVVRWPLLAALPIACTLHMVACGDTTHVYSGRLYVEQRDCMATSSSIEVVEGDPAANDCAPTCLVQTSTPDGRRPAYVSTMCPPVPFGFVTDGADPRCGPALAAFARNDTCLVDGGSTAPLPRDASANDASTD